MSFKLPNVYPLTDVGFTGLTHAEQVLRLAQGGATLIQLREKRKGTREFYESAKLAVKIAHEHGVKIIINDRADIAVAVEADGVHLGQCDLPARAARQLLGPKAIVGLSTHNLSQAREALTEQIDYLAVGPIFSTATKEDTEAELGLDGLITIRQQLGAFPLVAIGGISAQLAPEVLRAGADSVALISALLTNPNEITSKTAALFQQLSSVQQI